MKRVDKPKVQIRTRPGNVGRRDQRPQKPNGSKPLNPAQLVSRVLDATAEQQSVSVSDSTTGSESSEVYETLSVHYVDDSKSCEDVQRQLNDEESDSETNKDSISSSQGDFLITGDEKLEKTPRIVKIKSSPDRLHVSKDQTDRETSRSKSNTFSSTPKEFTKVRQGLTKVTSKISSHTSLGNLKAQSKSSLDSSEVDDCRPVNEVKEDDVWEDVLNGVHSVESDNEAIEENGKNENNEQKLQQKIEHLQMRVDKLEEELREVAALEIYIYSVVQEHGGSTEKLHEPARRLSRLYVHACKNGKQNKRKTVAGNIVSGLVLVAKSCGNDISRLNFWLSNIVVLREIVSREFGIEKKNGNFTFSKQDFSLGSKQVNGFMQLSQNPDETATFVAALEKVESWIFSRTVESVWSQVLTPRMRSCGGDVAAVKTTRKLLGLALGNQQQRSLSITLWNNAFQESLLRLCPVRAARYDCACLPVLARLVMEQCIARLDVVMFNAILRESAHQIATDPISDPIVDSKVLPIPAGDLSFGSGAQLKNSVGNWSRWLTDMFSIDVDDGNLKHFCLLNELSDLLMLPKDLLMDSSVREEVCPSIGLTLIKRILCNFTPDEFCPDPVPGFVLEELNAESIVDRRLSGDSITIFPRRASAIFYSSPSCPDVAKKVPELSVKSQLSRNTSIIRKKGYTSDEDLDELDSPLASIIITDDRNKSHGGNMSYTGMKNRYELLRQVWSA